LVLNGEAKMKKRVMFDCSNYIGVFDDFFMNLGYDEILATVTPFGRTSLQHLKELVPKFKYIRVHNLFTSAAGDRKGAVNAGCDPVSRNPEQGLEFDFTAMDSVFDILVSLGYIPYVEFGFIPRVLSKAPVGTKNSQTYPPEFYEEWRLLIRKTVEHFCARYGEQTVKKAWYFELWNEPNSTTFWKGSIKEFCVLYDYTVAGLFDAIPDGQFRVGGPALSEMSYKFLRGFIAHCLFERNVLTGQKGTKLDFLSFHVKGGWAHQTPSMNKVNKAILSYLGAIEYFMPQYGDRPGVLVLPKDIEIHITELDPLVGCDLGINENAKFEFRNTEYYTAFLSYTAIMIAYLRAIYNFNIRLVFSDNLHFADEAGQMWKGTRCLTTAPFPSLRVNAQEIMPQSNQSLKSEQVIAQPAVLAYQLLSLLHSNICALHSRPFKPWDKFNAICSRSPSDHAKMTLIICRYVPKIHFPPATKSIVVELVICGIEDHFQNAEVKEIIVDHSTEHTYNRWVALGKPLTLSEAQLQEIRKGESLVSKNPYIMPVIDNQIKFSCHMMSQAIICFEIKLKKGLEI
jgi:xylan 1,4-beta-xylosidase